jgi:hypothetical protein
VIHWALLLAIPLCHDPKPGSLATPRMSLGTSPAAIRDDLPDPDVPMM